MSVIFYVLNSRTKQLCTNKIFKEPNTTNYFETPICFTNIVWLPSYNMKKKKNGK